MREEVLNKYEGLKEYLRKQGSVAVAFSGGVDSAFLMYVSKEALGSKTAAVTAKIHSVPERELKEAKEFCLKYDICQIILEADELKIEGFKNNPKDRCYICKRFLFSNMLKASKEAGYNEVVEGSNLDDEGDYRPGLRAIEELKIKSPLRECGFTKSDIREASRELGLPTWDKPSYACLASRFVYGEEITHEKLKMVERAEDFIRDLGFKQVRVRLHKDMARIEVLREDIERLTEEETRSRITKELKNAGFKYVTADLSGYRTGSMNEAVF